MTGRIKTSMPPAGADIADAAAANLIVGNRAYQIGDRAGPQATLLESPIPVYGATWNRRISTYVGTDRIS